MKARTEGLFTVRQKDADRKTVKHTDVKENKIEETEGNRDQSEGIEGEWTQIPLGNFPEIFEKNDKLSRYFQMPKIEDNYRDKSFMIIKLYDEHGTCVNTSRLGQIRLESPNSSEEKRDTK